jgi:glycogen debranching enzyme
MSNVLEIDGRTFVPASEIPFSEWNCVLSDRPVPTLTLKDDDLFLITDTLGNISGTGCLDKGIEGSLGLFCRDTRFLSRLELQIDERSLILLSSTAQKGFALSVLCANPQLEKGIAAETIGFQRDIVINGGLFEEIQITNYNRNTVSFTLSLSFEADFLDLFEVRGFPREKRGTLLRLIPSEHQEEKDKGIRRQGDRETGVQGDTEDRETRIQGDRDDREIRVQGKDWTQNQSPTVNHPVPSPKEITLAYLGLDGLLMESRIQFNHCQPDELKGYTAIWHLALEPHKTTTFGYHLHLFTNNRPASAISAPVTLMQAKAAELLEEQNWSEQITQIRTDNKALNQVIQQAERDLYLLRQTFEDRKVLSAGVPWFSTLFGRDSIIAASQTLIFDPEIARDTLFVLAHYQGKTENDWRDEQPGKILHEIRLGEMARCQEVPHTPYYGSVDATPLWLMLYAEYYAWTQDQNTLDQLWDNALSAMDWIDSNTKTGYLSYDRRSKKGLVNQGWKDSEDCIVNSKGQVATGPITLSEVQAYVYAAKVRMGELARMKKLHDLADLWEKQARDLKVRFNRDFWLSDPGYCALALDGDGKQVDSITSNPGHCLSMGLLDSEKAYSVAERLQAPDMFNGWGIRTLSSMSPVYNPMGYHVGSVWPHDNGLIALGLRSLGLVDQALELAQGLMDMTLMQPYQRPPELFCGYERTNGSSPVQYPVACSPQAWASGALFQLLQMMLNLVPDAPGNHLRIIEPALLKSINHLSIHNLKVGRTIMDLEFERSDTTTACRVTKKRGNLRVVIEV